MILANLLRQAFAVLFVAIVSAVFSISFAAIIYTGDLAAYFDRGIGLTLLGCAVLGIIGAITLSYRGSILSAQDVPAILLAGGVATIVAQHQLLGEVLFATVACLVAVTSATLGVVALLVGRLRLAMLARYIPYPVLAGFLAATGLLLLLGGMGVAVGTSLGVETLSVYLASEALWKWGPVCVAAVGIVIATRKFAGPLTLPMALLAATFGFYALIAALGLSASDARAAGFLLGPFTSGSFLTGIGPQTIALADWTAIATQVPVIVAIVAISLLGTTLNASGLELELRRDLDINREVFGVGVGNTIGAFFGGLPGYHLLGETMLAGRLGLTGPVAGISSAAGCLVVLLLGGTVLSIIPVGLFATVIAFLGLDLLYTWLWAERRNFRLRDYAIVVLIPIIAITFSFLLAIAFGLVVAFCFFVITYAKLDFIRSQSSVATRRSFVERPDQEVHVLASVGDHAQIIELTGYLFFATANVLRERVQELLIAAGPKTDWLIIDFKHVSGLDISTWRMLQRLSVDCETRGVCVLISGIDRVAALEKDTVSHQLTAQRYTSLDQALEHVEDALLAEDAGQGAPLISDSFADIFALALAGTFDDYVTTVTANTGDVVIKRGSISDEIYILQSGQLAVSVSTKSGNSEIVAQIRPGSVIGELAYYSGRERTADIIADGSVQLLRVDMARLAVLEQNDPRLAADFHKLIAQHMARRLSRTTMLLRDLGF